MSRFLKKAYKMPNIKSAFFVPSSQEKFIANCTKYSPSLYLLDMEDSVPVAQKEIARKMCSQAILSINLKKPDIPLYARPNDINSDLFFKDMETVLNKTTAKILKGFSVPKIECVEDMDNVSAYLLHRERELGISDYTYKVIPWIESSMGIVNLVDILKAHRNRIEAAAFGGDDYCTDLKIKRTVEEHEMDLPRKLFALYCNAAQVVPMDTPYLFYKNADGLKEELVRLKQMGFKGKFAIHPSQVDIINEAMMIPMSELEYSQCLVSEFEKSMKEGKAAINFRGIMVDIAAYKRALNIVKECSK